MNLLRITLTLGFLAVSVVLVSSEEIEEYDYADSGAAPQPPQPSNPPHRSRSPLLRQNKPSPLISNANKLTKQSGVGGKATLPTKAATAPAPAPAIQEEPEEEIVEYDENPEEQVEPTTEAPKKTIKPTKRPFRSNDDLLAALKRRRQQVQSSGSVVDKTTTTSTTTTPSSNKKSSNSFGSSGRRNRNGGNRSPAPQTPQDDFNAPEADSGRKGSQSRKYNNRSGTRSAPAPVLEEVPAEEQPKPKFGRGSRRS